MPGLGIWKYPLWTRIKELLFPPEDGDNGNGDNGNDEIICGEPGKPTIEVSYETEYNYLTWEEPDDTGGCPIEKYQILRRVPPDTSYTVLTYRSANSRSHKDADVEDDIRYWYKMTCRNEDDVSVLSEPVSVQR